MVGDGLTAKLALLHLVKENFKILWVANKANNSSDKRTTLLSISSINFLKKNNLWEEYSKNFFPTKAIKISSTQEKFTELKNSDNSPLAWLVANEDLNKSIEKQINDFILSNQITKIRKKIVKICLKDNNVEVDFDQNISLKCQLIIGADGSKSNIRELVGIKSIDKLVSKQAIVCTLKHNNVYPNTSWQRFLNTGSIALLAMKNQKNSGFSSLIWVLPEKIINDKLKLSAKDLEMNINNIFGNKLGKLEIYSKINVWKLNRIDVPDPIKKRCGVIGDAAHNIYPLSGQGFNLSIGDIKCLTDELKFSKSIGLDFGEIETLERYKNKRKINVKTATFISDGLDWLFTSSPNFLRYLASNGIIQVDRLSFFKKLVVKSMTQS